MTLDEFLASDPPPATVPIAQRLKEYAAQAAAGAIGADDYKALCEAVLNVDAIVGDATTVIEHEQIAEAVAALKTIAGIAASL